MQHTEFEIHTDHKSLLHLADQRLHTPLQHKAFVKLMGLQFKLVYKKGVTNSVADGLSRQSHDLAAVNVSAAAPAWLENLQRGYEDDPMAKTLLTELSISNTNEKGYTLQDDIIRWQRRIWWATIHWPSNTFCKLCIVVAWEGILVFWPHIIVSNAILCGPR